MSNEMERIWKEASWCNLRFYTGICLEWLSEITTQDSGSPGRDLNPGPTAYKAGVPTTT
jgi:hypothetical protein